MTELLNKAFEAVSKLSREEQDAIARELIARIEADARWDELFPDPRSETLLKRLADEAEADEASGGVLDHDPANRPR